MPETLKLQKYSLNGNDDTATKLLEVSERTRERLKLKDYTGYTKIRAENAEKAVERELTQTPKTRQRES